MQRVKNSIFHDQGKITFLVWGVVLVGMFTPMWEVTVLLYPKLGVTENVIEPWNYFSDQLWMMIFIMLQNYYKLLLSI